MTNIDIPDGINGKRIELISASNGIIEKMNKLTIQTGEIVHYDKLVRLELGHKN